ncbi:MarR family transcriptional regulator [bacterium 1XD42-94]|jgi:DNA-binding MarR family transcriptional regulator|nr:MarR family transcriptional regulator [bacterium 1XD42-76]NBK06203.1 MarR family transcriptional regulator [bacterium 1XD42-94]
MGRKRTYKILLSDEDKKVLHATINNKKTYKMTVRRCQILLELDENVPGHLTQIQIAKTFGVSKSTVSNTVSVYYL